jgi:inositol polyphosphate 5-phosphatase INPP5B/F
VLRIENSNDFHVAVTAKYERSCYGMSLQELVHTLTPVSTTQLPVERANAAAAAASAAVAEGNTPPPVYTISTDGSDGSSSKLSIPKELWRLVDGLWAGNALKEKDLFNSKADPAEVVAIRYALDTGADLPSCSPHSLCEALTSFIAALPQPLLPPESYPTVR